jgi:hypothetical protein
MYPESFVADAFSSAETSGTSYTSTPAAIVQGSYVNFVSAESDTSPPLGCAYREHPAKHNRCDNDNGEDCVFNPLGLETPESFPTSTNGSIADTSAPAAGDDGMQGPSSNRDNSISHMFWMDSMLEPRTIEEMHNRPLPMPLGTHHDSQLKILLHQFIEGCITLPKKTY